MQKKKVLFVAHHLTVGGIQKSLISALKAIDYDKYDVTLYLRKNRLDLLDYIDKRVNVVVNEDSTHYYAMPKALMLQAKIKALKKSGKDTSVTETQLADYIRVKQFENEKQRYFAGKHYDVAISYLQGYEAQFVAEVISADRKAVFYQGSVDETHDVHEKCLHKFDAICVEHSDVENMLLSCYDKINERQFRIIENYTDVEFINQQAEEIEVKKGDFTIATVGRFAYIKGMDMAVESVKILKDKGCSFIWYIIGDGPEMTKVKELVEKYDLADCVVLTGMQKNPYPYVKNADIFVQPSREEAMSVAVLEAQVFKKPVVTTKTVGGMNIVRDGITGVQTEIDSASLAEGIEKLINNPGLVKSMSEELKKVDYSAEKERYKSQWAELLEG